MIARTTCFLTSVLVASTTVVVAPACAQAPQRSTADSVQRVVQEFYSWYVPRAVSGSVAPAWMDAVRQRPASFAPAIVAALRRDSVLSASNPNEVVGLDGDPFLNAQDFCDRYVARRAVPKARRFLVEVIGEGRCASHSEADVVVEVARVGRTWRFENFRYLDPPDDLLSLLKRLHADARRQGD